MKINKLIKKLKKIRNEYGNVEVYMLVYDEGETRYEPIVKIARGINDEVIMDYE